LIEEIVRYAEIKLIEADNGIPLNPWPTDDEGYEVEPRLLYIWRWWQSMSGWREQGMGIGPISHREILAWATLYRIDVSPSEVETFKQIDLAYRLYEQDKAEGERSISEQAHNKPRRPQSLSDTSIDTPDIEQAKRVVAAHRAKVAAAKKAKESPHG
jgi:hypothetical protein